jgi:hypothetical protein
VIPKDWSTTPASREEKKSGRQEKGKRSGEGIRSSLSWNKDYFEFARQRGLPISLLVVVLVVDLPKM